ncbi:MAG: hypothetical protein PHG84_06730 [Endomicrobiaceae bacterium]|nr:hypothetical protein [Endomicrobiaceae bacterium]
MKKLLAVTFSFVFLGLVGCASTGKVSSTDQVKITVLETIPRGDQPSWVKNGKDFYQESGKMFYVAVAEGFTNLEASKRASFASAQTKVAEQVKNTIGVEFGRSLETGMYEEATGGYLKDVFMSNVNKINISGVVVESTYTEKIQEQKGDDSKVYYRTYSLVSIPEATYKDLVKRAFSDTSAQVTQNKSAQDLLVEAEKRFYNKEEAAPVATPVVTTTTVVQQ